MNKLAILSVLALFGCASGFQSPQSTTRTVVGFGMKSSSNLFLVKPSDDFPEEESEEYTGSVDWDAEWKKEVSRGERPGRERPGQDFYKSEAEVAAIKATNKAAMKGRELTSSVKNSIPDIRSLSGDWKVSKQQYEVNSHFCITEV
jgi:hypothetical protein